jgi:hypothetical protein
MQRAASTTTEVRNSPVTLVVALEHEGTRRPAAATPERCVTTSSSSRVAEDAEDGTEAAAVASSIAAAAAAGSGMLTVACGQLYMDGGESLQVPAAAQGYLLTQLTAAAAADYSQGLLSSRPETAAAAAASAGSEADAAEMTAASTGDEAVTAAAAGFKVPVLEAVTVLGLPNKAAGGADTWSITVNGKQLAASQVQYDVSGQLLRLIGLQQQLAKGLAVQWERA